MLLLVDLSVGEAAQVVKDCIAGIRDASDASPAEREGIAGWEDDWRQDHQASPPVVRVIVDAMARYLAFGPVAARLARGRACAPI